MANPWVEAESLSAAKELAGFDMSVPSQIDNFEKQEIRVCTPEGSRIIEVTFSNVNDESVRIRKGEGNDDISGDYNQYDGGGEMQVGSYTVSMRGNGSTVKVATWKSGGFTYAINISNGLDTDSVVAIIENVR